MSMAAGLLGLAASAAPAHAAFVVIFQEVGSDVVATGTGTINTTALSLVGSSSDSGFIRANLAVVGVGPASLSSVSQYAGVTGPPASALAALVLIPHPAADKK